MSKTTKKVGGVLTGCVFLVTLLLSFATPANAGTSDSEFVSKTGIDITLTDRTTLELQAAFNFNDSMSKHYKTATKIGLEYEALEWLDVGFGYSSIYKANSSGVWKKEDRPFIKAVPHTKINGWKVKNRFMLEYRDKQGSDPKYRFRSKLVVGSPWKLTPLKLKPYVAGELFVQEEDGYYKNRAELGASMPFFHERVSLKTYWMHERDNDAAEDIDFFGTALKFKF